MNLLRLMLLFLLGFMLRRLLKPLWTNGKKAQKRPARSTGAGKDAGTGRSYADLTEQGIDDADFEEIP